MLLGSYKTIHGKRYECVSHTKDGRPIYRRPDGKRLTLDRMAKFHLGEVVSIVGHGKRLQGVVVSLEPIRAKVTTDDAIWHGAEVAGKYLRRERE